MGIVPSHHTAWAGATLYHLSLMEKPAFIRVSLSNVIVIMAIMRVPVVSCYVRQR
jgi:hypothetical protein